MNNIKVFIIIIFFLSSAFNQVYALSNGVLSKIENDIYGFDYDHDNDKNRIARLEKTVYGKVSTGDINKRIKKLSTDTTADVIDLKLDPVKDTFLAYENEKEENNVNYPIVDEIEKKLFNKTYKNRDFHTRIVTIEKKLFGKIYDVDDYSKRMDRIKAEIMPEALVNNYDSNVYFETENSTMHSADLSGINNNLFKMPFGQRNYTRPYANYGEYGTYKNTTGIQNNLNDDLTQMEYDMFGTEFSSDDTPTRIKRLNSVNKAKKSSSKYDSQKFSQRMSTAMEIGAMILMILAMVL